MGGKEINIGKYHFRGIEYTYQVSGQAYSSKRMVFGALKGYGNPAKAEADLQAYPLGEQITVYYDPEKPSEAVLERKAGALSGMLVIGIICLVLSVCIACPLLIGVINAIRDSI